MEQRAVIKFHAKLGTTATETYKMMRKVYGDKCLSKSKTYEWHKRFLGGREMLEDDERAGRPSTSRTKEKIEQVREFVTNNSNASLKQIEEALNINRETIRLILKDDLGKTKVCSKFVPHTLTEEQKSMRIQHSKEIIRAANDNPNFLKSIVTGGETWCFQYDPEAAKSQNAGWESKSSAETNNERKVPSTIGIMFIVFFDSKGILHKEFVPTGQTVTDDFYLEILQRLMAAIRRNRPEYRELNSWCLLHDNSPIHNSLIVRKFLAQNQVCVLNHSPYSPDLAPCDYSLFPKIKIKLKGCFFDDIQTIQKSLEAIPQIELELAFELLLNRCKKCIESKGDYFE